MICGYIYKIPFPNGKYYIGLTTTSLEQRQKEHKRCAKSGDTKCLYNALRKYDIVNNFELIEIDTADTLEELCKKEMDYILKYNSYYVDGNGYNMTYGGDGTNGYIHTEEDKQRQSERQKKYYEENPEEREKMKIISQAFWNNPDSTEKMSKLRLISQSTPEAKKNMSEGQQKRFEDNPELRTLISEQQKKRMENPEARQKVSDGLKSYYANNEDAIQKNSEAMKKYNKEHPEAGKEHSEKLKKLYQENPEKKQQMSEAQKKRYEDNPEAGKAHGERMTQYYIDKPEKKQQMSETKKKYYEDNPDYKKKRLDTMGKNKPFDVFTTDGTFINTFTYQYEAKEYLQKEYHITSNIKIDEVLIERRNSSAGFIFKYK